MALSNDHQRFGGVAKTFHWLTALLILTAFPLGVIATNSDISTEAGIARTAWIFSLHKTVGVTAFLVAALRILWALSQPRPAPLHPERKLETFAAEAVHWLLYGSMLLVPLSGWIHHAAAVGYAPIWWPFGQSLPFVPKSEAVSHFFGGWHFVLTKLLALSIFLHIAGAVKHHVMDKDATLRRMMPGTPELPDLSTAKKHRTPLIAALGIYLLALGLGSALGWPSEKTEAASLEAVASDWTVERGSVSVTVKQLGTDVTGKFSDWTAAISFDPETETGQVRAVIATGSLTLGSVTKDALGPDYLDSERFAEAVFEGDIARGPDGLAAVGTLDLRGVSMPLTLPFELSLQDGLAKVKGETVLDRIDFGVGSIAQPGDGSLGFDVTVKVDLTARAPE